MNKKLILTIALLGVSGVLQGSMAGRLAQAGKSVYASIGTWRKAYQNAYQRPQANYRPKSVNFRPSMALVAGSALNAGTLGLANSKSTSIEFNVKNIDAYPGNKEAFATFIHKNIATSEDTRTINYELIRGIVHFISTYPDQAFALAKVAREKGQAVHQDIQYALAAHDPTFICNIKPSYVSPSTLIPQVLSNTAFSGVIQGVCLVPTLIQTDQKIINDGAAEFSPEYYAAWKIAGKDIRKQLGKDIARGVAVSMCESIAEQTINKKINDKKVSSLLVKVAKPLVENAYNNQFTLRNNMRSASQGILTFGIGELILDKTNVTKAISIPAYNKNGYNFSHYGKRLAQWTLTNMVVPTFSSAIADVVCDKAFGAKPEPGNGSIPIASIHMGDL